MGGSIVSTPLADGNFVWVATAARGPIYKLDSADRCVAVLGVIANRRRPFTRRPRWPPLLGAPPPSTSASTTRVGTINGPVARDRRGHLPSATSRRTPNPGPAPAESGIRSATRWTPPASRSCSLAPPTPTPSIYAIDAVTGKLVWRVAAYNPPPGMYDVGAGVTDVSSGGQRIRRRRGLCPHQVRRYFYAIDLTTGALVWQVRLRVPSISTAALSGRQSRLR